MGQFNQILDKLFDAEGAIEVKRAFGRIGADKLLKAMKNGKVEEMAKMLKGLRAKNKNKLKLLN